MRNAIIIFIFQLLFLGPAYGQAPEKRFVGNCSFSGFALVSDSTYRGNITRFDDRMGDGYNLTQLATGYEIFDGRGLVFSIGTIHSSTNFTADVTVTAKVNRGFEPFGSGQVYYPTANGLIPPSSQEQAGLSPTQKARIDRHNVVTMQSLIGGRDSVYSITNVPDTSALTPVMGDIFVNAAGDTLGVYNTSWVLFFGGGSAETADGLTILGDGTGGDPFRTDTTLMSTRTYADSLFAAADSLRQAGDRKAPVFIQAFDRNTQLPACASSATVAVGFYLIDDAPINVGDVVFDIDGSPASITYDYYSEDSTMYYFETANVTSAGSYFWEVDYFDDDGNVAEDANSFVVTAGRPDTVMVFDQDSILVTRVCGVEVSRDTITATAGGGIADGVATAGTHDTLNEEIDISVAGPGSDFSIDISALASDAEVADTSALLRDSLEALRTDIDDKPGGSGTTNRTALWTAAATLGDSYLLQSASALTLDADKAFRITGGTTASRPPAVAGLHWYNTSVSRPQWSDGVSWYEYSPWTRDANGITYTGKVGIGTASEAAYTLRLTSTGEARLQNILISLVGSDQYMQVTGGNFIHRNVTNGKYVQWMAKNAINNYSTSLKIDGATESVTFQTANLPAIFVDNSQRMIIGAGTPSARLQLPAGTATAGTASLKIPEGANTSSPQDGEINHVSDRLNFTTGSTVNVIAHLTDIPDQNATYYEEIERQYTLTTTGADTIITVDTLTLALATDSISMSSGLIENLKADTVRWQVRYDFYYLSDEDACFALLDLTTDGTETPAAIPGSAARGEQVSLNGGQMPGRTCLVDVPPGQKIRLCVKGNVGVATSMDISFLTITINEINRE